MKKFWVQAIGMLCSLVVVSSVARGTKTDVSGFSARVRVVVDAEKDIGKLVKTYMKRELLHIPSLMLHFLETAVIPWRSTVSL